VNILGLNPRKVTQMTTASLFLPANNGCKRTVKLLHASNVEAVIMPLSSESFYFLHQSSNRTSSGSRQTRRFEDLSFIKNACSRCGSASVAAKTRHFQDLSNLGTVNCISLWP
jgi:hypothetical protein